MKKSQGWGSFPLLLDWFNQGIFPQSHHGTPPDPATFAAETIDSLEMS